MLSSVFVDRPRLAIVIAIVTTIAGALALSVIPVSQFPNIVPPQVQVTARYPGASAAVVEATVAQPLESAVNGVDRALYMRSNSANDGTYTLSVSFALGTDPDIATVNVNNRVQAALARLPTEVQRNGVTVRKQSSAVLQFLFVYSPDASRTPIFLSNYTTINIIDRLARVVDGLTFLAKVDAGQIPMKLEPLNFAELVRDAGEDALFLANPQGLRVEVNLPDEACMILGDRHRLRQLLLNLADNAVKYNEPGGFVRISLVPEAAEVVLEVANPGPGIPAALAHRVFERFFRGYASQRKASEGSGLGLNIVQWIVQRHGGTIRLETAQDGVTRAQVRLPRVA
jgi:hypothetical protein